MGRERIRLPARRAPSSFTSSIATATSATTRRTANKGERCIAALVIPLSSLLCASLIIVVEEVNVKEGEEEKKEKRALQYSSICKHSFMCST